MGPQSLCSTQLQAPLGVEIIPTNRKGRTPIYRWEDSNSCPGQLSQPELVKLVLLGDSICFHLISCNLTGKMRERESCCSIIYAGIYSKINTSLRLILGEWHIQTLYGALYVALEGEMKRQEYLQRVLIYTRFTLCIFSTMFTGVIYLPEGVNSR